MTTVSTNYAVATTSVAVREDENQEKKKATITFKEWWNGEKSLTSTAARRVGWENLADFLEDKDKVCTDGQDDGKLGFKEGAKSFLKGLVGGIPKAMINHPLMTLGAVGIAAGALVLTGGAAAPLLWGIGAGLVGINGAVNGVKAIAADTDAEKKAALEGLGTTTTSAALLGMTYKPTMNAAKTAGVNTDGNIIQTMKSSAEISARNAKANYMTWKTGAIHANSNQARFGFEEVQQSSAPREAVKLDLSGTQEEILARYPQLSVNESGEIGVKTSWGFSKVSENSMLVKYGEGDYNILSQADCIKTYVQSNGNGTAFDPATVEPGTTVNISKVAKGEYKVVPAGTKYIDSETVAGDYKIVGPGSVLRKDAHCSPYSSSAEFMLENTVNLTPKQVTELQAVAAQ